MRPNYVILIVDQRNSLRDFALYYSMRKCSRALRRFNSPRGDEQRLYKEDMTWIGYFTDAANRLSAQQRGLTEFLWTKQRRHRNTFINMTEAEFEELSAIFRVPVPVLKNIAAYETDYFENVSTTRWDAFKRKYLPRFLYNLV